MFATGAALTTLATLVGTVTGVGVVTKGVPLKMTQQASAYVALAGQDIADKNTSQLQRGTRFWVVFGYRTDGDVATAEATIADWIDGFIRLFYADRTLGRGAPPDHWSATLDARAAESPAYAPFAGQEVRLYPLVVTVLQRQTYPTAS